LEGHRWQPALRAGSSAETSARAGVLELLPVLTPVTASVETGHSRRKFDRAFRVEAVTQVKARGISAAQDRSLRKQSSVLT
jgi:hypothetical protein